MPELPEVQTIVAGLQSKVVGKKVLKLEIILPKSFWLDEIRATGGRENDQIKALVEGKEITSINRRGKLIILNLSQGVTMLIHLKMTGQLIYIDSMNQRFVGGHPNADMGMELPVKSTRGVLWLDDGSRVYFNDQRQFGYIKVIPSSALATQPFYQSFGPEPFEDTFTAQHLSQIAHKRPKMSIKQLLLDQSVVAGIGNIYADESLFESKIHPASLASNLTIEQLNELINHIRDVLRFSIEHNGTSSAHYLTANGEKGDMQNYLKVYRRHGSECPRCGAELERTVVGGRGTHYCPQCQIKY